MAAIVEIPPEQCSTCSDANIRPNWGECPLSTCRQMGRVYDCPEGHVTVATWHVHREVPTERPRWHCGYE